MTPESLFQEALAKSTPEERAAFLRDACADNPELRISVEAMLDAHLKSENSSNRPSSSPEPTRDYSPSDESPVRSVVTSDFQPEGVDNFMIGDKYKLLQKIGEGGMGEVWVAKQETPIKRRVALKLIKAGMDSKSVLARFEQERQALAMMDHPNIAKILDGGITADRRPYFVMELVSGLPLLTFCDREKLGVEDRLKLFVSVCQAVQHAHQKGIIHRDLKPGNILVTLSDGRPVAKVIDFGVAKATGGKLTDESMMTQFGAVIGTLEYMSPEQAGFSSDDVDTRADIYSLGVILYELLTGLKPFDSKRLRQSAMDEMIRILREEEPPKPSTKFSMDGSAASLAAVRQMEPKKLAMLMRGELDWVVMKCLEKQRDRRYETANGLAREIERYLNDEPVEARPPSAMYRLKKFVKRNKGRVLAGAIVLLALIGGIIGTTFGLIRAEAEKTRAIQAEGEAREAAEAETRSKLLALEAQKKAEKARDAEKAARETTATQRRLALDTVRTILLRVDELMKNDVKLAPLRVEIIRRMLEDIDRIRDHAIKNPLEDRTESLAHSRMGEIYFRSNRIQDSADWLNKGYVILKTLADENPKDPNALRNLAAISKQLAETEWRLGNGKKSRQLHVDALRLHTARRALLASKGVKDEFELTATDMDIAEEYGLLAYDDLRLGEPTSALANYRSAEAMYAALPPPFGNMLKVRRTRAEIQVRMGDALSRLNDIEGAEKHYRAALQQREEFAKVAVRPKATVNAIKVDLGQSRMYLGDFYLMVRRDYPAAHAEYGKCLQIFSEMLKESPDDIDLRQRTAATHYRLGMVCEHLITLSAAVGPTALVGMATQAYEQSLNLRRDIATIDSKDMQSRIELILSLARLGRTWEAENAILSALRQAGEDPQTLFQVACGLSVLSGQVGEVAARSREKCFETLDKLIDVGWNDRGAFDLDPDFDTIRSDPRFKAFLKRMK